MSQSVYLRLSGLVVCVISIFVPLKYDMCVFEYCTMLDIDINILCIEKIAIIFGIAEMDFEEEILL